MTELRPLKRASLSDGIVEQLTGLIARGALKPGDRIPSEKQLCEQFGVGRTSVREALRSLAVAGILESRAGNGTFVATRPTRQLERVFQWGMLLDKKLVDQLAETRLMLESQTAFLAATRATPNDLEDLRRCIHGMEHSLADPEQYLEHDLQFHLIVAHATQNAILENLLTTIRGYLQVWIRETLSSPKGRRRTTLSIRQHKRILEALKHRDAEQARQAMAEHVMSSSSDLRTRVTAPDSHE
jgi:GntR family transcriptional repressor for pyruvate dehydrogenase complex